MKKALFYGAILIGMGIVLDHATGSGQLLDKGANGGVKFVRALRGSR